MIFDPHDMKIAMDEHGIVYHATSWKQDDEGNPIPEWTPLRLLGFEEWSRDFRRPEW